MVTGQLLMTWLGTLIGQLPKTTAVLSRESGVPEDVLCALQVNDPNLTIPLPCLISLFQALGVDPAQALIPACIRIGIRPASFSSTLRQLRTFKGLTQQQVSDAAGMPIQTYVQYEGGRRTPGFPAIAKLARVFGVPLERFEKCEFEAPEDSDEIWRATIVDTPNDEWSDDDETGLSTNNNSNDPIPF